MKLPKIKYPACLFCVLLCLLLTAGSAFAQPGALLSATTKTGIEQGDFAPALAELDAAIKANSQNVEALMLKAEIRRAQGAKYTDLIETEYTQVLTINRNYWQAWAKAGDVCLEDKGWSCSKFFSKVKELKPDSVIGYLGYARGVIDGMPSSNYADLVKTKAIPDLLKALELDKSNREVYREFGRAYVKIDASGEAITAFSNAISSDPQNFSLYAMRGDVKKNARDYPGAIADYSTALKLSPKYTAALYARAEAYEKVQEPLKAIDDYDQIIQLGGQVGNAYFRRGLVYASREKYALAIDDFSQAIEKGNKETRECGRAYRGESYLKNGETAEAAKDFSYVWETGGDESSACYGLAAYHIGNARFKSGKYLWALTAYQNALKNYDKPEVREARARAEEYYQKYESSAASVQNSSSGESDSGEGYNAPNIRNASPARYREAAAAYDRAVASFNRASRSYTDAVEKYNAAGEAQFLYKGTLARAYRERDAGRSILEALIRDHGDYLPQNRLNQINDELQNIPL